MSWTPEQQAYLLANHRTQRLREIARAIGKSPSVTYRAWKRLADTGQIDPMQRRTPPPWTEHEVKRAAELVRAGYGMAEIGAMMGRTRAAVLTKLYKRRGPKHSAVVAGTISQHELCRIMGLSRQCRNFRREMEAGTLKTTRCGMRFIIRTPDLIAFLQDYPHLYDYDRIPDRLNGKPNPWKTYARRVDPTAGHYAMKQAARALGVSLSQVSTWRREGKIRMVRLAGTQRHTWWVPKAEVARLRGERRAAA